MWIYYEVLLTMFWLMPRQCNATCKGFVGYGAKGSHLHVLRNASLMQCHLLAISASVVSLIFQAIGGVALIPFKLTRIITVAFIIEDYAASFCMACSPVCSTP